MDSAFPVFIGFKGMIIRIIYIKYKIILPAILPDHHGRNIKIML